MDKLFVDAETLSIQSFQLADNVYRSGFRPDIIVALWRGGSPIGLSVHEFFDYRGHACDHIAVRISQYTGIGQRASKAEIIGDDLLVQRVAGKKSLLIVDDIYETGLSVDAVFNTLDDCGEQMPDDVRIACTYFKPLRNQTDRVPDYFVQETDDWVVFPHELIGLTEDEIRKGKPPALAELVLAEDDD